MADDETTEPQPGATGTTTRTAAGSSGASSRSRHRDPLQGDPGPGFDPAAAPPRPDDDPELEPLDFELPEVSEDQVRDFLLTGGDFTHAAVGVGEYDWVMTVRDLERIAPPLTRIVNRYPVLGAIVRQSDYAAVAGGAALYTWRSLLERRAVLEARAGGQPPPPPPGPRPMPPAPPPAPPSPAPAPSSPGPAPGAAAATPGPPPPGTDTTGPPPDLGIGAMEVAPGYETAAQRLARAHAEAPTQPPQEEPRQ